MGQGGAKDGSLPPPLMVLSCPIPASPNITRKIFLPHPHPLGPCKALPYPVKLYFLLICPTIITNFFNKNLFHNKNLFEIKIKFISSNQTNFYLKLNN